MASLFELNLNFICDSEVPMPVCILGLLAYFSASAATSISFLTALVKPQTVTFFIIFQNYIINKILYNFLNEGAGLFDNSPSLSSSLISFL